LALLIGVAHAQDAVMNTTVSSETTTGSTGVSASVDVSLTTVESSNSTTSSNVTRPFLASDAWSCDATQKIKTRDCMPANCTNAAPGSALFCGCIVSEFNCSVAFECVRKPFSQSFKDACLDLCPGLQKTCVAPSLSIASMAILVGAVASCLVVFRW
jgi:hypothetical protein